MQRKILSILLAAVVTAGTLLGCGSTKESTGTDKAAEASEETAADTTSDTVHPDLFSASASPAY